jgi:hypothetical protein
MMVIPKCAYFSNLVMPESLAYRAPRGISMAVTHVR